MTKRHSQHPNLNGLKLHAISIPGLSIGKTLQLFVAPKLAMSRLKFAFTLNE